MKPGSRSFPWENQVSVDIVVEREGKLVALVFADTDKMKQELQGKTSEEVMEELRTRVNKLLPLFCRLSKLELVDKEFEKTPKRSNIHF